MEYLPGIFANDLVNKDGFRISASSLANAVEHEFISSLKKGLLPGLPSNVAHDWHRPLGWCVTTGFLLEANVARQVGYIAHPSTEDEIKEVVHLRDSFTALDDRQIDPEKRDALLARTGINDATTVQFFRYPTSMLKSEGVARRLYKNFFDETSPLVDKHGLVDYRELIRIADEIEPGVFHDKQKNVLLFAHGYFRRSLSHRNALNESFLAKFSSVAARNTNLSARIRLDEDILGYPEGFMPPLEMDYWRGPKFDDDIASIPSGVSVHANSEEMEGISQTHFWWKSAETRGDRTAPVRTFEAEELRTHPSFGISYKDFGCRYVHAEFDQHANSISHFDGAIRCYGEEEFSKRQATTIDKAGKYSRYTKLFRLDGDLSVSDWKALCTDYFRGNTLVPEYFSGEVQRDKPVQVISADERLGMTDGSQTLKGFIGYGSCSDFPVDGKLRPIFEEKILFGQEMLRYIEYKPSMFGEWLAASIDLDDYNLADFQGNIFNAPRIFVSDDNLDRRVSAIISEVLTAIEADAASGILNQISFSMCWIWEKVLITVSVAGPITAVRDALHDIRSFVKPSLAPSSWIEPLEAAIAKHSPIKNMLSNPLKFLHGMVLLRIPRAEETKVCNIKLRKGNVDIPSTIVEFIASSPEASQQSVMPNT